MPGNEHLVANKARHALPTSVAAAPGDFDVPALHPHLLFIEHVSAIKTLIADKVLVAPTPCHSSMSARTSGNLV